MRPAGGGSIKRVGRQLLRVRSAATVARRFAALRGRSLVLVYHRIGNGNSRGPLIVPTISLEVFRRQIEVLGEIGRIVPLTELLEEEPGGRKPRVALTFDDDYSSHAERVLPVLRALDLPATFFLSGRALHGLGGYWFETLEQLIARRGLEEMGDLLGMPGADATALALGCEDDPHRQRIVESEETEGPQPLSTTQIEALARAEMTVGFHTLHHPVLPLLSDEDLRTALVEGRDRLTQLIGHPLVLFAYPHGRAEQRTAHAVGDAGYEAAWTGRPGPMHRGNDPYLLPRWEPGPLTTDEFVVSIGIRLNRAGIP